MPSYRARASERRQKKLALDDNKVFNHATNSWVDKYDFEVASKPDTRNPNVREGAKNQKKLTQTLSKNQKLNSIN
jgi:hypothetical protein